MAAAGADQLLGSGCVRLTGTGADDALSGVTLQGKGLLSTEAVITVPSDCGDPQLSADSNFYEFRRDNGQIYLADELLSGETYSVIVTTNSGLYRYQTDDLVLCTGHTPEGLPQLRFAGVRVYAVIWSEKN